MGSINPLAFVLLMAAMLILSFCAERSSRQEWCAAHVQPLCRDCATIQSPQEREWCEEHVAPHCRECQVPQ